MTHTEPKKEEYLILCENLDDILKIEKFLYSQFDYTVGQFNDLFSHACPIEKELDDFNTDDLVNYIVDSVRLNDDQLQRIKDEYFSSDSDFILSPQNLNDIQKVELFTEKYDNIPIADLLNFLNKY